MPTALGSRLEDAEEGGDVADAPDEAASDEAASVAAEAVAAAVGDAGGANIEPLMGDSAWFPSSLPLIASVSTYVGSSLESTLTFFVRRSELFPRAALVASAAQLMPVLPPIL